MRCFFAGMGAALTLLLAAALLIPLYSDYQARSETDAWLVHIQPLQTAIETAAARNRTLRDVDADINIASVHIGGIETFEVTNSGTIVLRGGREGQVVVLIPVLQAMKLSWTCIGGPAKAVPIKCRKPD